MSVPKHLWLGDVVRSQNGTHGVILALRENDGTMLVAGLVPGSSCPPPYLVVQSPRPEHYDLAMARVLAFAEGNREGVVELSSTDEETWMPAPRSAT